MHSNEFVFLYISIVIMIKQLAARAEKWKSITSSPGRSFFPWADSNPKWYKVDVPYDNPHNNENSSGDEIANVNFLRRYGTYVLQNTKKREPTSFNQLDDS